jgi:hypothetical protein
MASATVVTTRRIARHADAIAKPADAAGYECAGSELIAVLLFSDIFKVFVQLFEMDCKFVHV